MIQTILPPLMGLTLILSILFTYYKHRDILKKKYILYAFKEMKKTKEFVSFCIDVVFFIAFSVFVIRDIFNKSIDSFEMFVFFIWAAIAIFSFFMLYKKIETAVKNKIQIDQYQEKRGK